jgi:ubiquinone biosynthesis protein UbiJ
VTDLASALAALAESLEPAAVSDRVSAAAVLDVTEILAMPLDRFAREGQCLEIRIPWLDVPLWFVPDERDAVAIALTGASRGRVWTASELAVLMALPERRPATVEMIARAKLAVDGDIVEVRPRQPELG